MNLKQKPLCPGDTVLVKDLKRFGTLIDIGTMDNDIELYTEYKVRLWCGKIHTVNTCEALQWSPRHIAPGMLVTVPDEEHRALQHPGVVMMVLYIDPEGYLYMSEPGGADYGKIRVIHWTAVDSKTPLMFKDGPRISPRDMSNVKVVIKELNTMILYTYSNAYSIDSVVFRAPEVPVELLQKVNSMLATKKGDAVDEYHLMIEYHESSCPVILDAMNKETAVARADEMRLNQYIKSVQILLKTDL